MIPTVVAHPRTKQGEAIKLDVSVHILCFLTLLKKRDKVFLFQKNYAINNKKMTLRFMVLDNF